MAGLVGAAFSYSSSAWPVERKIHRFLRTDVSKTGKYAENYVKSMPDFVDADKHSWFREVYLERASLFRELARNESS